MKRNVKVLKIRDDALHDLASYLRSYNVAKRSVLCNMPNPVIASFYSNISIQLWSISLNDVSVE